MPLVIKLDEDLSPLVGEPLATAGHTVRGVVAQGWGGTKDPDLWPRVVAAQEFFVTGDKGFGDIRVYPPGTHSGLLVLRPERESIVAYRMLIDQVLAAHSLEEFVGVLVIASPLRIRIRRAAAD